MIGASFGSPLCEKTFSGVARYLFDEFDRRGLIAGYISTKQIRPQDFLTGIVDFSKVRTYGRPGIKPAWLWRVSNVEKLSRRVAQKTNSYGRFNVFFQIGTQVWYDKPDLHYCFTDMTISQAATAGQFSIKKLDGIEIEQAVKVQKMIFKSCKRIFVTSHWTKKAIIEQYDIPSENIVVVGLGASVCPKNMNTKSYDKNTILFIGRDWDRKGGTLLLDAFCKVKNEIKDSKLIIVGCSPNITCQGVEVWGYLDKNSPRDLLRLDNALLEASVMCVPSLFEPFGICFLEAQYYGVVPVTFRGQGREDAIINAITGILVDTVDSVVLADQLIELLKNKFKLETMAQAGRNHVINNYTWDVVAQKIINVIQQDLS